MRRLFWLSDRQFELIKPHLPYRAAGKRREDGSFCSWLHNDNHTLAHCDAGSGSHPPHLLSGAEQT